jgi:hypothetical protein
VRALPPVQLFFVHRIAVQTHGVEEHVLIKLFPPSQMLTARLPIGLRAATAGREIRLFRASKNTVIDVSFFLILLAVEMIVLTGEDSTYAFVAID